MEPFPLALGLAFGAITAFAVGMFYLAARRSGRTLAVLLAWLLVQTGLGLSGFYTVTNTIPPHFALLVGPPVLFIIALLATPAGRRYLDGLRLEVLTLLHVVRVPVELVLLGLFLHHAVPQLMTFEGRNFDILSGLTAPFIYYVAFRRKILGKAGLIGWNFLCLALLLNIVVNALLSAPSPIQRFAFEQPNVAILHFPFVWLPACVVPLVLLAHVAALRQLIISNTTTKAG
jgi:hypothetical protein